MITFVVVSVFKFLTKETFASTGVHFFILIAILQNHMTNGAIWPVKLINKVILQFISYRNERGPLKLFKNNTPGERVEKGWSS